MNPIFITALHVFVIVVIGSFIILCILAAIGKFDHWTTRYIRRAVKRPKFLRRKERLDGGGDQ